MASDAEAAGSKREREEDDREEEAPAAKESRVDADAADAAAEPEALTPRPTRADPAADPAADAPAPDAGNQLAEAMEMLAPKVTKRLDQLHESGLVGEGEIDAQTLLQLGELTPKEAVDVIDMLTKESLEVRLARVAPGTASRRRRPAFSRAASAADRGGNPSARIFFSRERFVVERPSARPSRAAEIAPLLVSSLSSSRVLILSSLASYSDSVPPLLAPRPRPPPPPRDRHRVSLLPQGVENKSAPRAGAHRQHKARRPPRGGAGARAGARASAAAVSSGEGMTLRNGQTLSPIVSDALRLWATGR